MEVSTMDDKRFGYAGKLLRVDLSTGDMEAGPSREHADRFIGGRGVGQWMLFDEVAPGVDAFDPENIIILGTGPLTGTLAPASARLALDTKNPLTGGVNSSNSGGHFAPELKYAGFDFVVIRGKAEKPVYLWIEDGRAELRDATPVWGTTVWQTHDFLLDEHRDPRVRFLAIGQAGENLAKSSCVIVDRGRALGRGGAGAVMGSKNLKGVAVRGTGGIAVADPKGFMEQVDRCWEIIDNSEAVPLMRTVGTLGTSGTIFGPGAIAYRNFQDAYWDPEKFARVSAYIFKERFESRRLACFNCPIYCSCFYDVKQGPFAGLKCEGFQANHTGDYMSKLDISDPDEVLQMHALCAQYGLDIDNSSGAISWAFEMFERGLLTTADTDGLELTWGDSGAVLELIPKMAHRQGIGDLLADGAKEAADKLGRGHQYAMHVKGQDLHEAMRAAKGWAFGVVVAPRGGGHLDGAPLAGMQEASREFGERVFGVPTAGEKLVYEGKPQVVFWTEKFKAVIDMLGVCYFTSIWEYPDLLELEPYAELFRKATGRKLSGDDLMRIGQQVHNVEKAFNTLHAGFTRQDDFPPRRLMEEPIGEGIYKGELLDGDEWERMLDEYYALHRWDGETGWQTGDGLRHLGLEEVARRLAEAGRLVD
jgi:aldehyde:ferredoxin oxidoreductase